MPAFCNADRRLCVESAPSKFSEADLQTGSTDSLFRKSPASGMAEEQSFPVAPSTVFYWHRAELHGIKFDARKQPFIARKCSSFPVQAK